jgi:ketosteroid isomerase-like protein
MKEISMAARAARKIETPATDVENAEAVVADLEQRLMQAESSVAGFAPARRQHSYAATMGSNDARAALDALAAEQRTAEHTVADLTEALAEARRRRDAATSVSAVADDALHLENTKLVAEQYVEEAEAIDRLLVDLKAAVDRHAKLAVQLVQGGCLPPLAELAVGDTGGDRLSAAFAKADAHNLFTGNRHEQAAPAASCSLTLTVTRSRSCSCVLSFRNCGGSSDGALQTHQIGIRRGQRLPDPAVF